MEHACKAQNIANIQIGRHGLALIPRNWIIENIEVIADYILDLDDEWEFRRLLEVYEILDQKLYQRFIQHGQNHPKSEIREAANDYAI